MPYVVGEVTAPVTADSTSFEQAMGRVKEEGEKASKHVSNSFKDLGGKISKSMEKVGKSLSKYVTAPLMGAGILAAKSAIDFESAFAGVRKTVDATEEEFAALEKGIREMAMILPSSANEIAGVAEAAGQLGIANDNILGFTRTMIDLGEATNLSADQAATQLARLANITQMPQDQFDRLGSSIVTVGNNLATTEAEIVDMAMGLAGVGKQIGLSEAQIIGMAGALSSVGVEAQAGGSAFSRVLSQMQLAAVKGGEELQNFASVAGMSAEEFARKFKEDAAGALISFIQGLGNVQVQGGSAIKVLSDMGIEEIRLRDALLRTAGAGDLLVEAVSLSTQAWEENQSLSKETQQRYATLASQLKIMRNHITELAIEFGEVLAPYVKRASDKIKEITEWFRKLDPEMKENVLRWAAIIAIIGPALMIGAKVILMIKNIGAAFAWLAAHPTAVIAFGIGLLIAAAIDLIRNWDTVKVKLLNYWEDLRIAFNEMVNGVISSINWMIEGLNKLPGVNIKLVKELDTTRRIIEAVNKELDEGADSSSDFEKRLDGMKAAVEGTGGALNDFVGDSIRANYLLGGGTGGGGGTWLDSVKEKISAIGTEIDISRAKFALLAGELEPTGDETQSLNLKLEQEKEELGLVGDQVSSLSEAVKKMATEKGEAAQETRLLTLELLQAKSAYQELQKAIEETQKALDKSSGNEFQEKTLAMIQSRQMELVNQSGGMAGALALQKVIDPSFKMPEGFDDLPGFATGAIAFHPMIAKIAEREPEAIIPLSKMGSDFGPTHITQNVYIYGNANRHDVSRGLDDSNSKLVQRLRLASPGVVR